MKKAIIFAAFATLAACSATEEVIGVDTSVEEANIQADSCHSEEYRHLLGTPVSEFDATKVSGPVRVLGMNDIMTEDYQPLRLNIFYDGNGTIINMYCQ
ncbi:I78 family peptidase inhibitor [Donghicola tyrosinivorans]|uniref:Peptidase inhibitor I78 family protein n=1 Tax=Donghicola tyrosinivorans TaxID=1652492 RepID=A0A2T0WXK0_9RHOB|nr:I78 family peptidase inhibitor [Donghicola tyrosinivorans]PRY91419.1 peptidase inhibitor I78 family protein [Donghicola tyrosinivorans]